MTPGTILTKIERHRCSSFSRGRGSLHSGATICIDYLLPAQIPICVDCRQRHTLQNLPLPGWLTGEGHHLFRRQLL